MKKAQVPDIQFKLPFKWIATAVVILGLYGVAKNSTYTIPANHVGIVYNTFGGGVQEKTLQNGFHLKNPFDIIYTISTELNTVAIDRVTTQTQDAQYIDTTLDVKYQITGSNAMKAFQQFKDHTIERMNIEVVKPIVQKAVEQVTVDYDVLEILGTKRNEVYSKIEENVKKELEKFGLTYRSLVIVDSDAKDEIERAIQDEAVAQQAVNTAKQHQAKVEIEAQTKILEEKARAEQTIIKAEAEAQANKKLSDSLTENLVKYMEAQARQKHGWVEVMTQDAIVDVSDR